MSLRPTPLAAGCYLKQGGLFDAWVADCPLELRSPNAPGKRDLLGTLLLSALAGDYRYAYVTSPRCDAVNPPLLGMNNQNALVSAEARLGAREGAGGSGGLSDWVSAVPSPPTLSCTREER